MNADPPKRILDFLRWFCREDYLEEIEGDLVEIYRENSQKSPTKAKFILLGSIVRYCRPLFARSLRNRMLDPIDGTSHALKVSWRSIRNRPFFTTLNTIGLAVGMASALFIILYVVNELSFDKMFPDADRIVRVNIDNRIGGETTKYAAVSGPLAAVLKEDFPHTEMVSRFRNVGSIFLRTLHSQENVKEDGVIGADSSFLKMFGLTLLYGDSESALKEPNTLILTKTAAEKHFDVNEAVGKTILLDNTDPYIVTGILPDLPTNSFLRDHHIFLSIESFDDAKSPAWNNWNFPTFVKLSSVEHRDNFQEFLGLVKESYLIPWAMTFIPGLTLESARASDEETGNFMRFNHTPLTDIHLYSNDREGEITPNSDFKNIYILSLIGLFILALACVNYVNLSTAQSLKRAKEVGIRKTLGSNRRSLVKQFLLEAGLIAFYAMVLATTMAKIAMPHFNTLAGTDISLPYNHPTFWFLLIGISTLLALVSGFYPAFVLSRFSPLRVLKQGEHGGKMTGKIRSILVVFQFSVAVFLIIGTLVVFKQLKFIQNKDLGYEKDQILVIDDINASPHQKNSLKIELERLKDIKSTSLSSFLPTPSARNGSTFFPEGKLFSREASIFGKWRVDHDYISTLDLEIIAGRGFDREFATDSNAIVLNEAAAAMIGMQPEKIIGLRLTDDFHRQDKENMKFYTVIGVLRDFHYESLRNDINAMSLTLGGDGHKMLIKLVSEDFSSAVAHIEDIWRSVVPGQPFHCYFMDDSFNETYRAEQHLVRIFTTFTLVSILIACLGLFGLVAFSAEKRVREIGIRKILGASVPQITYLLSFDFLKLVAISICVSVPLGWLIMNQWLQDFSYRTEISWWLFVVAGASAAIICLLTVSYQSIKSARANPVTSLRNDL